MPVAEIIPLGTADRYAGASTGNLFDNAGRVGTLFVLSTYYTGTICATDAGPYRSCPRITKDRTHA